MVPSSIFVAACTLACAVPATLYLRQRRTIASLRAQAADLRAAQTQQEQALHRRSHLDTIKDEFISTVSHELRTPLTSIRGALGILSAGDMGTVDAKSQNLLRIAVTNTDRLIRLINEILDLERMESGRAQLQFRRCVVGDLALQAAETMTSMADAAHVRIELTTTLIGDPIVFDGDADRILQVLTNLLSNAIKFSPPHSTIAVDAVPTETSLLITVSDEGRGIPTDKLDAVFGRFHQVESSDARQKGGTGLGLAICRTIVQQHRGHIWATPNPTAGVTFSVELPRSIATPLQPLTAEAVTPIPAIHV